MVPDPVNHRLPSEWIAKMAVRLQRRRQWAGFSLAVGAVSAFVALVGLIRWTRGSIPFTAELITLAVVTGGAMGCLIFFFIPSSHAFAAVELDRLVPGAADRFKTWRTLGSATGGNGWTAALKEEIASFAGRQSLPVLPSFRWHKSLLLSGCCWLACFVMQASFMAQFSATNGLRVELAGLLRAASNDVEQVDLELESIAEKLDSVASELTSNLSPQPRDVAVRALAESIATIHGVAAAEDSQRALAAQSAGSASAREESGSPGSATNPITASHEPPMSNEELTRQLEKSKRLERLVSRLEEHQSAASGISKTAADQRDGATAQAMLDEILSSGEMAITSGADPAAPGPTDSGAAAPGPGSENDFGDGGAGQSPEIVNGGDGPNLMADVSETSSGAVTALPVVSRESSSNAVVQQQLVSPIAPIEFAEQSISIEDIPLGARELVRRYFLNREKSRQ